MRPSVAFDFAPQALGLLPRAATGWADDGDREAAAATQHGPRRLPSGVLTLLARDLGQAFREVAICSGHRYVRVAASWLPDFRTMRQLAADAPVTVINDQIGAMRPQLRACITR